jgi:hypothetical protein
MAAIVSIPWRISRQCKWWLWGRFGVSCGCLGVSYWVIYGHRFGWTRVLHVGRLIYVKYHKLAGCETVHELTFHSGLSRT